MLIPVLIALPLALAWASVEPQPHPGRPLRVACLGDSITFGTGVAGRAHNPYPAQLGHRLGPGYEVAAFGCGGATLLRESERPYVETEEFRAALAWGPDVALVILGTNDTCQDKSRRNWIHAGELQDDAWDLVRRLREGREGMRVLLCSPPPIFPQGSAVPPSRRQDLTDRAPRIADISRTLRDAAAALEGVEFVDLGRALEPSQVPDGIHPDSFGAAALAERLREALLTPHARPLDLASSLISKGLAIDRGDFEGFQRLDFGLPGDGAACSLVLPHAASEARPWIWTTHAFGAEPELDLALLDRGFHVAHVDLDGFYGAPGAVERMEGLRALLAELGLCERAVLEGIGRGGLEALSYAVAHPDRVAGLVANGAVCDFRSWPGGRNGQRSDTDWEAMKLAYGLSEEEAWAFEDGPLDRLEGLAQAGVPLLVLVGTTDTVVSPAENGELLAARYVSLGGPVELWRKPGSGHRPHGLDPGAPLVRAVQRACGAEVMPSARPTPSAEHRGEAAGWGKGTWWDELERLNALCMDHPDLELVFLGDSITQALTGAGERLAQPGGPRPFDHYEGNRRAVSLGLSGDRTEQLLWRIGRGAFTRLRPRVVVLQIGVNNLTEGGHTPCETAAGIAAVVALLRERQPQAAIVLCGPFSAGDGPDDPLRQAIDRVHEQIAPLGDEKHVYYRDPRPLFLDQEGHLTARMDREQRVLTSTGRAAWLADLEPLLAKLLGE